MGNPACMGAAAGHWHRHARLRLHRRVECVTLFQNSRGIVQLLFFSFLNLGFLACHFFYGACLCIFIVFSSVCQMKRFFVDTPFFYLLHIAHATGKRSGHVDGLFQLGGRCGAHCGACAVRICIPVHWRKVRLLPFLFTFTIVITRTSMQRPQTHSLTPHHLHRRRPHAHKRTHAHHTCMHISDFNIIFLHLAWMLLTCCSSFRWVFLPCTVLTFTSLILNLFYWRALEAPGRNEQAAAESLAAASAEKVKKPAISINAPMSPWR